MQSTYLSRLSRLEEKVIAVPDRKRAEERLKSQCEAKKKLEETPELALITEADISTEAWEYLQIGRAWVRGDFEAAERLFWKHFKRPEAPGGTPDPFVWGVNHVAQLIVRTGNEIDEALVRVTRKESQFKMLARGRT